MGFKLRSKRHQCVISCICIMNDLLWAITAAATSGSMSKDGLRIEEVGGASTHFLRKVCIHYYFIVKYTNYLFSSGYFMNGGHKPSPPFSTPTQDATAPHPKPSPPFSTQPPSPSLFDANQGGFGPPPFSKPTREPRPFSTQPGEVAIFNAHVEGLDSPRVFLRPTGQAKTLPFLFRR